jgi:FdhD protein
MNNLAITPVAITPVAIRRYNGHAFTDTEDLLATEEPLEIQILYGPPESRIHKNITVTMRTPGNDAELAAGFLFTEGIINQPSAIEQLQQPVRKEIAYWFPLPQT